MLVDMTQLLQEAKQGKYALGAFNVHNLETTLAVVRGAVAARSPLVLQISESTMKYGGLKIMTAIVEIVAREEAKNIPVALHLDHGKSFRTVAACIQAGFSSIMIDASELPMNENIILTKQAVDYAHRKDVIAQGELGVVKGLEEGSHEDRERAMTDPQEAAHFVDQTGVDTLAVAVGNVHGIVKIKKGNPGLNIERLKEISKAIPHTPLVLHGASGLGAAQLKEAIENGIGIVNFNTELKVTFTGRLRETLSTNEDLFDPRDYMRPSIESLQQLVAQKLEILGSAGTAG
ncbi:MAG: tagatose-bisphosphate aldolase [Candidatus Magasanikbacteria bacterium CG10_big_fil_rev_8_21_14_0_10_40_10]|uniref:Tagatose-bisphosphate aldolase n=2 Tax=Parcubacteria group TaxID=1794811 RepID=A0A2M6W3D3_9BACT|nr:MAG: tagatose-bisphosphate aldolase [Candidatus Magasanikbacteria bacterium CG10_big_fil_rev_8_21_14_0_10_40_10]